MTDRRVLTGKTAIVTGGSRGIGRGIVERLARDGATVVFCYQRDADAAAEVEKAVAAEGGTAYGVRADLGEPGAVDRLFAAAEERVDGLDVLVNNAGLAVKPIPLADMTDDDYDRIFTVNAKAVFQTLRHAARHMRDHGRIVNISTLNTVRQAAGLAGYCGSKAAIEQFTVVAARELGPRGITVNTISPGGIDTELLRSVNQPEVLEAFAAAIPLGRLGQPADIADVVAFIAGPESRYLTGQNIRVTGGEG